MTVGLLICITWLFVLSLTIIYVHKRISSFYLAFDLPTQTVEVAICKLPDPTRNFTISVTGTVHVNVKFFFFFGVVIIDNSHCQIRKNLASLVKRIPRFTLINPWTAWKIRKTTTVQVRPFVVHSHENEFFSSTNFVYA